MLHLSEELQKFKHIVWDFNGTLIDDAHLCVYAVNPLLKEHGLPEINVETYRQAFRFPVAEYYVDLGFRLTAEEFSALSHRFNDAYHSMLPDASVFDGTHELLQDLRAQGKTLSILTAAWQEDMLKVLRHFNLQNYFHHTFGLQDRLAASKIQRGHDLMKHAGFAPSETVLLGDTLHDNEVGRALGIEVLLLTEGHMHEDRLQGHGAKVISRSARLAR